MYSYVRQGVKLLVGIITEGGQKNSVREGPPSGATDCGGTDKSYTK